MENQSQGGVSSRATKARARRTCLVLGVVLAAACERPDYTYVDDPPRGAGATAGFAGTGPVATGGSASTGAEPPFMGDACRLDTFVTSPTFASATVSHQLPARRVLYTQMTDEEVQLAKETGAFLPAPPSSPSASVLTSLLVQLSSSASELRRPLLLELVKRFQVTRAAWPNLWALRMIEQPSSRHMNPVRITLKPEAWVVRLYDGTPTVVDVNNAVVSLTTAAAEPERIAAVYYVVDDRSAGAIATCETGKRELALGNLDMVEEVAIGTADILERMNADITALEALFEAARGCSSTEPAGTSFHSATVCQAWRFFDASTESLAYRWSLANPVEAYRPTAQNLSTLIQALKGDRFEPKPFVTVPRSPVGAGGAGGEGAGGAGGEGTGGDGAAGDAAGGSGAELGGAAQTPD